MSDLKERLRDVAGFIQKEHGRVAAAACLATEAAARIEQLEAALREIATYVPDDGCPCSACHHSALARAALEERT